MYVWSLPQRIAIVREKKFYEQTNQIVSSIEPLKTKKHLHIIQMSKQSYEVKNIAYHCNVW